jgi:hypothetical protein
LPKVDRCCGAFFAVRWLERPLGHLLFGGILEFTDSTGAAMSKVADEDDRAAREEGRSINDIAADVVDGRRRFAKERP